MILTKRAGLTAGSIVAAAAAVIGTAAVSHAADRSPAQRSGTPGTTIPAQLRVPDGNKQVVALRAQGVQIYACTNGAWTFLEPAATLWKENDRERRPVALHSRGPVWISTIDGSAVNAAAVPGASVPQEHAVPELLLKATANRGTGVFGLVSYVQRLDTKGGLAPTGACAEGSQVGVPYSATYRFYVPAS